MKKILVFLMAALTLVLSLVLASCSNDTTSDTKPDDVSALDVENTVTPSPEETDFFDDGLEDEDFGGVNFRILYRNGCSRGNWAEYEVHRIEIWAEEENGDVINDALYRRNRAVENRFNVNIVGIAYPATGSNEGEVANYARRSILSDSNDFDLVVTWSNHLATPAAEGMFVDWHSVPYLNMEKPWWIADAMRAYTVKGKSYLAMNDTIFSGVVGEAAFIMFNKELVERFGLGNPYQLVFDNKWTLDSLNAITRECYADENGDGKRNADDIYGFTSDSWGSAYALMWAGGAHMTATGNDGLPYYDLYTERNVNLFRKVYDLFYENPGSAITNASGNSIDFQGRGDQAYLFSAGNAVFLSERVGVLCTPGFRNAPFEFGVLPMPKYDESQEKYLTMINEHASAMAIPVFNTNLNMTGKIIEALCAESRKQLVPAYYEVALKTKYSRDEESVQMLDLIFEGVVYDFGLIYNLPMFDIYQTFLSSRRDPSTFTSYIESNEERAKAKLQEILAMYENID